MQSSLAMAVVVSGATQVQCSRHHYAEIPRTPGVYPEGVFVLSPSRGEADKSEAKLVVRCGGARRAIKVVVAKHVTEVSHHRGVATEPVVGCDVESGNAHGR